ncbi:hypothetical protein ACIA5G_05985 [Amycolatopsis sp. NPDC051758]|uniref:hypothetical protein n=1 Tax=Amycolatopsis sp. NPDC051758 TaxID=3363935 RepID=UPI0037B68DF6
MADRLFVPAPFVGLLATMPAATATPWDREHWLDNAYYTMQSAFSGPHGLSAMRLARVFRDALNATRDEIENGPTGLAA